MDVNNENPKIWFPYEIFYIESMLTITRTAMADQSMVRNIIEEISNGETKNQDLIIDLVQNLISHAASISRYFWPSNNGKVHKRRGQRLREAFVIHESNPLKDRNVRNFIEHFDEKLDTYLQEQVTGNFFPTFIGIEKHSQNNVNHYFRAYFIDTWKFKVLGLEYNIVPIINELIRINQLLEEFRENGGRLPKE